MYVVEKKIGDEYVLQVAKCKHCLGTEFIKEKDTVICRNCGKEYKE